VNARCFVRLFSLAFLLIVVSVVVAPAQTNLQVPVQVHPSVSRTAMWIGDRATYTLEVDCAGDFDIVEDDLASARLRVDGGEIVGFESVSDDRGDRRRRRISYTIVTFSIDATEVRIAAVPVRYYSRQRGVDTTRLAPSGSVTIPAAVIGIRSSLPSSGVLPAPRVPASVQPSPVYLFYLQWIGLGLIAAVIVPVAIASADLRRHAVDARARWSERRQRRAHVLSLDSLKVDSPTSGAELVNAYARLDAVVRDYLALATGTPARALTPQELRATLERSAPALPHSDIESLLERCEDARYARVPPPSDGWSRDLAVAEEILGARVR
jgi:hypothetical protein